MKLKYSFEAVDMGDEIIYVPVGKGAANVSGVLKLNREGQEIIELLKEETSEEAIVSALAAKYENDRTILVGYVRSVLDRLNAASLLVK